MKAEKLVKSIQISASRLTSADNLEANRMLLVCGIRVFGSEYNKLDSKLQVTFSVTEFQEIEKD